jgi:hypothetical protein
LLVTMEPTVTTPMSPTSAMLAPVIARRFHKREMGPLLTVDRLTCCPQWGEVENHIRGSASDLTNPLLRRRGPEAE